MDVIIPTNLVCVPSFWPCHPYFILQFYSTVFSDFPGIASMHVCKVCILFLNFRPLRAVLDQNNLFVLSTPFRYSVYSYFVVVKCGKMHIHNITKSYIDMSNYYCLSNYLQYLLFILLL